MAVNTMVVATISGQVMPQAFKITSQVSANQNSSIKTIEFVRVDAGKGSEGYKKISGGSVVNPLTNISQIGKHFLVKSTAHPRFPATQVGQYDNGKRGLQRQYTQALSMRKDIHGLLLNLCRGRVSEVYECSVGQLKQIFGELNSTSQELQDRVNLTIKDYQAFHGLSNLINQDADTKGHLFTIKGPMGKGLEIKPKGRHVAYAAGTGILVFIDLVGHLILSLLSKYEGLSFFEEGSQTIDIDDFKLVLNASFRSREEAVCLELMEGLKELCRKYERTDLFVFNLRLSSDAACKGKWTTSFFFSEMTLALG